MNEPRQFSVKGSGARHAVCIDGHDISRAVRGLTVSMSAGCLPEVTLDLAIFEAEEIVLGEAHIVVTEPAVELLEQLGWTRPEEIP